MPWSEAPVKPMTPRAAASARVLRQRLTEPDKRLWWHLRHRLPIAGTHFRRQVPIGQYVADFCCLSARLVIEVDGGGHSYDAKAADDARRTAVLEAGGYQVLRFTNGEVMREIDNVLDTIFAAITAGSPPHCGGVRGGGGAPELRLQRRQCSQPKKRLAAQRDTARRKRNHPHPRPLPARGRGEG
ncbi:endonuclease domain-containing protein [Methylobacterium haplocladii]|uniref:DUF559 domain-containing protein n=1 Tax=Methylobacterium haplocladii TaxID=1176176 RepID=A0A512ITN8_9HYPH|nr:DUF559 domain-containing protein [Methylobacterium haplocladii]GEP01067.1 hypothetical protein MHA02_34540 [Methylobacterium haplocladii]GJD85629.1 hypothetical protein HPGCJGGD_3519 [Methylobacterium haplocladii]GLS61329.1 hypothetical protein GCM10007887_40330 [Methylobacterium haplocladii]